MWVLLMFLCQFIWHGHGHGLGGGTVCVCVGGGGVPLLAMVSTNARLPHSAGMHMGGVASEAV